MVLKETYYLLNVLCAFVPCEVSFPYPDTTPTEPKIVDKGHHKFLNHHGFNWNQYSFAPHNYQHHPHHYHKKHLSPPVVTTHCGIIHGFHMKVVGGKLIRAFEGIPYAEPPIGHNRFKAPVKKIPWEGITLKAVKKGPPCLQYNPTKFFKVYGSESCLFLNVYAPMPRGNGTENHPIMIFIHGGGYLFGSGNDYGPSYLLQEDLILVTINYRLGVMGIAVLTVSLSSSGFLSTGDSNSPGNYGLKDQQEAIKWVHKNALAFGGDPKKITLFGHEAGGASVQMHMVSSRTPPYFQAGISSSGTAFNYWAIQTTHEAVHLTKSFAKKLNCPHFDSKMLTYCMKRRKAIDLVRKQVYFLDNYPVPIILFRPVIEDHYQIEEPFISQHPVEAYSVGQVAKYPWICGYNEDEGLNYLLPYVTLGTIKLIREMWNKIGPDMLDYDHFFHKASKISSELHRFYFSRVSPKHAPLKIFSDMITLRRVVTGVHAAIRSHSTLASTFAYVFSYNGKYNLATRFSLKPHEWGVGHGEDLTYVLNSTTQYKGFKLGDPELILSKIMSNLFHNFAQTGNPSYTKATGDPFKIWVPYNHNESLFLRVSKKIKLVPEPYIHQIKFWQHLHLSPHLDYNTTVLRAYLSKKSNKI